MRGTADARCCGSRGAHGRVRRPRASTGVDKGQTKRTVNALTRRIGLSVLLILLVILAIWMGWITPHGVGRPLDPPGLPGGSHRSRA